MKNQIGCRSDHAVAWADLVPDYLARVRLFNDHFFYRMFVKQFVNAVADFFFLEK